MNPPRPRRLRVRLLRIAIALAAFSVAAVAAFPTFFLRNNFAEVDPGRVYRSAQPRGDLDRLIIERRYGSILNLRGGSWIDPWYRAEVHAARRHSVDFYDMHMLATRRPSRRELLTLLDLFGRCRYPLLIHCKSGSDRTGLASALYLLAAGKATPSTALDAFSIRHGHVPFGGTERLHEPFREYASWLESSGLDHSPARLRDWVAHHYRSDEPEVAVPPLRPGPRGWLAARDKAAKR